MRSALLSGTTAFYLPLICLFIIFPNLDPKKLVTTKQYAPYAPSNIVVESLENSKSGSAKELTPDVELLSAEEKIEELNSVVQQKNSTLDKLEQDLSEVQVRYSHSNDY